MQVNFTLHSLDQMQFRKISQEEVLDILQYPDFIRKRYGKHHYIKKAIRGTIGVCCEKMESHIKVLTVYWL